MKKILYIDEEWGNQMLTVSRPKFQSEIVLKSLIHSRLGRFLNAVLLGTTILWVDTEQIEDVFLEGSDLRSASVRCAHTHFTPKSPSSFPWPWPALIWWLFIFILLTLLALYFNLHGGGVSRYVDTEGGNLNQVFP